jgi:ribosomal protein S18 acetylase RimI-like enzyme
MVEIRIANKHEVKEVTKLALRLFPNVQKINIKPEDIVLVAEKRGQIIGFLHIRKIENKAIIKGIGVDYAFQNRGVGSALIEYAFNTVLKKENEVYLRVKADNFKAMLLYNKYGFFMQKQGITNLLAQKANN